MELASKPLTPAEQQMLDLEAGWWKYPAAKETLVRERFDVSSTVYYQRLNALIDQPAAEAYAPLVVRRLRRLRAARARHRTAVLETFEA